jgi:hypothetical protein
MLLPRKSVAVVGVKRVDGVTEFDATDATLVPFAFDAVTVNVYAVPFARPRTYTLVPVVVALAPPGDAVAVYEVAPADAVQLT